MKPRLLAPSRRPSLPLRVAADERLAEFASHGSEAAFEAIVHRYRGALLRHCARVVGDAEADEAVQDALLRAHRALTRGATVYRLGPWLHAIAHNCALQLLRGRRRRVEYHEDARREPPGAEVATDAQHERLEALTTALLSLPDRQRQALVMREFEGRSYDEIADHLGASNGAVRQLLNRARTAVRERLGALIPVELVVRWANLAGAPAPSRALTLAGTGAMAAKISSAILLSAAPVAALAPIPVAVPKPASRHEVKLHPNQVKLNADESSTARQGAIGAQPATLTQSRGVSFSGAPGAISPGSAWSPVGASLRSARGPAPSPATASSRSARGPAPAPAPGSSPAAPAPARSTAPASLRHARARAAAPGTGPHPRQAAQPSSPPRGALGAT